MAPLLQPGAYLRMRREAAGLTIGEAAERMVQSDYAQRSVSLWDLRLLRACLTAIEADTTVLTTHQMSVFLAAFRFDPFVYSQLALAKMVGPGLAFEHIEAPQICRGCGCTEHDACRGFGGPCAWVPGDRTLCTACQRAEQTPPRSASPSAEFVTARPTTPKPGFVSLSAAACPGGSQHERV
jgi:hypothetical protein